MRDTFLCIIPPLGQPHAVFAVFISISGAWVLLCKELIVSEDSPYIAIQRITTLFKCRLGVLAKAD